MINLAVRIIKIDAGSPFIVLTVAVEQPAGFPIVIARRPTFPVSASFVVAQGYASDNPSDTMLFL